MVLSAIKKLIFQGDIRTVRAKKNISAAFICKGLSLLISFLIVPITLSYVGKTEYGIWMIISSIIHWFSYFDIGLGNGLRNKFAEAIANDNKELARIYVSSAFALIAIISILLFTGFFIASQFISWNTVLNTFVISNTELKNIIIMVFFFFCVEFTLKVFTSALQGLQKYALADIIAVASQAAGLVAIFVLVHTTNGSLFNLCLVYGGKTAVVMLIASFILFKTTLKDYKPSLKNIHLKKALPLISLGWKFFLYQLVYMVVTQSSVILIAQFYGPEDVTVYNLANRYMTIPFLLFMMVIRPFITAFTEAYTRNEFAWIKKTINNLNRMCIFVIIISGLLIVFSKLFFKIWVGDQATVPLYLIIFYAFFVISGVYHSVYALFLNGIGKIYLQFVLLLFQAILMIPLSILAYNMGFQLASILVVQILAQTISIFLLHTQYKKIINRKAVGIWNK